MYNVLAKKAQTVHTAVDHRLLTGVRRGEGESERERSSGHGSCTDKECTIPAAANSNLLTDEQWGETEHQKEKQRERERDHES